MQPIYFHVNDYMFFTKNRNVYYLLNDETHPFLHLPLSMLAYLSHELQNGIFSDYIQELESDPTKQVKLYLLVMCKINQRIQFRNVIKPNAIPQAL